MNQTTIGVSGNRGSFSEEAANYYCQKNKIEEYQLQYLISVENVLQALDEDKIDKAVFPIENSNGGIVIEAVRAMSGHNFNIENIFEIDIKMNLMTKPGTKQEDIKKLFLTTKRSDNAACISNENIPKWNWKNIQTQLAPQKT